jgi:RHS repeat-associated protein
MEPDETAHTEFIICNHTINEQNELVWASNAVAPSPTSTETCGSQTPGNNLNGGSYTTSYAYTNLGQLWQGPLAGSATNYQYLYCGTAPHQLSGMYAAGSTCSSKSGGVYKDTGYDAWGNVTGRSYNGTSETLAYDELDRLVKDSLGSGTNDYFAYDASGNRTVQRATSGSTTTLTVYAFGLEEYQYSGTGTLQNQTYYYSLGGRLIGELSGLTTLTTTFLLTDALGSVVAAFTNTKGVAALTDNQVYGPYGNLLYSANGTMGTTKGYTGQYSDPLTGLDYYVSRYYDPVAGVFLSADTKEGNAQGMNPYAYVAENPETLTDPSGQMYGCPGCGNSGGDGGDPLPPPQPPSAPGHGYTPPGQCPEGPGMCDGNSTGCHASHIGAMVCGTSVISNPFR